MLNYNLNIIEPNNSGRRRNLLSGKVNYRWTRTIFTAAGSQSGSIVFGTGSILYVPYSPSTFFVSGTYSEDSLGSALGQPINLAVTGSGVWPVTGSNILSIVIGSSLGFNQSTSSILSATLGNMNLSGSKISSSFIPVPNNEYTIDFGISHTKGNIYNPLVNVKTENLSPAGTNNVNGYSASFNLVKDQNIKLINVQNITSSLNQQFNYEYNFGVTSSLTASIQSNATGSTTMSISIPQAGINKTETYFNRVSAGTQIITASFAATNDNPYNVTASVTFNKGNTSNSRISYFTSASHQYNINLTSSFNIVKNSNESLVSIPFIDGITSGSVFNDYAFNITASFTTSYQLAFSSASQEYYLARAIYSASQFNYFTSSYNSSSLFSSSFEAQTDVVNYQFTASVKEFKMEAFSASFIVIGGGGGGAGAGGAEQVYFGPGAGGGAGGWTKIDLPIVPLVEYKTLSVGLGGNGGQTSGSFAGIAGQPTTISYWLNNQYFTASVNGGGGGLLNGTGGTSGNGFSGSAGGGGTVSGSTSNGGGLYLGGAQGVLGIALNPTDPPIALGSPAQKINLPVPNQQFTASMSGSGGNGGWWGLNGTVDIPAVAGTFGGGGGGGGNGFRTTSRPGAAGGDGALIIIYQGLPKLQIENGYTNYVVQSTSGSDYTVHYITGSNSTITYVPE